MLITNPIAKKPIIGEVCLDPEAIAAICDKLFEVSPSSFSGQSPTICGGRLWAGLADASCVGVVKAMLHLMGSDLALAIQDGGVPTVAAASYADSDRTALSPVAAFSNRIISGDG